MNGPIASHICYPTNISIYSNILLCFTLFLRLQLELPYYHEIFRRSQETNPFWLIHSLVYALRIALVWHVRHFTAHLNSSNDCKCFVFTEFVRFLSALISEVWRFIAFVYFSFFEFIKCRRESKECCAKLEYWRNGTYGIQYFFDAVCFDNCLAVA